MIDQATELPLDITEGIRALRPIKVAPIISKNTTIPAKDILSTDTQPMTPSLLPDQFVQFDPFAPTKEIPIPTKQSKQFLGNPLKKDILSEKTTVVMERVYSPDTSNDLTLPLPTVKPRITFPKILLNTINFILGR
jgi:hypothetical protein